MFNCVKHLLVKFVGVFFTACFPGTAQRLTRQNRRMHEHLPLAVLPPRLSILPTVVSTKPVGSVFHVLWLATQTREASAFHLPAFFISKAKGTILLSTGNAVVSTCNVCNVCTKTITSVLETSGRYSPCCYLAHQITTTVFLPFGEKYCSCCEQSR